MKLKFFVFRTYNTEMFCPGPLTQPCSFSINIDLDYLTLKFASLEIWKKENSHVPEGNICPATSMDRYLFEEFECRHMRDNFEFTCDKSFPIYYITRYKENDSFNNINLFISDVSLLLSNNENYITGQEVDRIKMVEASQEVIDMDLKNICKSNEKFENLINPMTKIVNWAKYLDNNIIRHEYEEDQVNIIDTLLNFRRKDLIEYFYNDIDFFPVDGNNFESNHSPPGGIPELPPHAIRLLKALSDFEIFKFFLCDEKMIEQFLLSNCITMAPLSQQLREIFTKEHIEGIVQNLKNHGHDKIAEKLLSKFNDCEYSIYVRDSIIRNIGINQYY